MDVPTIFSQIPLSPRLQNAPSKIMGNTRATATAIMVACTGFSMALKKLCVVIDTQRNIYVKQNILMACEESSSNALSAEFAKIDASGCARKNIIAVETTPMTQVPT